MGRDVTMNDRATTTDAALVIVRPYLSTTHLHSAVRSARAARDLEESGKAFTEVFAAYLSAVTTSVVMAVAFLEAMINELYLDIVEGRATYTGPLTAQAKDTLASLWDTADLDRLSILSKYETMLVVAADERWDRGRQPYQDAKLLVALRNVLTHFTPKSLAGDRQYEIAEKLEHKGFPHNQLLSPGSDPVIPTYLLSAGCAEWAKDSALALADDFSTRLKIRPVYLEDTYWANFTN